MGGMAMATFMATRQSQPSEESLPVAFPNATISLLTCKRLVAVGSGGGDITKGVESAVEGGESAAAAASAALVMARQLQKSNFEFPRAVWIKFVWRRALPMFKTT